MGAKLNGDKILEIGQLLLNGNCVTAAARIAGVSSTTVYNYAAEAKARAERTRNIGVNKPMAALLSSLHLPEREPCSNPFCKGRIVLTVEHHRQFMADIDAEIEHLQSVKAYHKRKAAELEGNSV